MSWLPEDRHHRPGYMWLSSNWIWNILYRAGLTRHKRDPFQEAARVHDDLTDSKNKFTRDIPPERKQEGYEDMVDSINEDVHHDRWAKFSKSVTRNLTWLFDDYPPKNPSASSESSPNE